MIDTGKLRVFVASPGDTEAERELVRACVDEINTELAPEGAELFHLVGWEIVRGTAQRPQEAINELVDSCHFMLCMFKEKWGSEPGGPIGYTSGTEEELFTALLGLGRPAHPMRDVWLAFVDGKRVAREVTELKAQVQNKHALLYDAISSPVEFRFKLKERLRGWAAAKRKEPRSIDLLPRSGRDILGADRARRKGEKLVELGQFELGVQELEQAVKIGGPPEQLALARVLARRGAYEEALSIVDAAIATLTAESPDMNSPSIAESYAYQANLFRRQKRFGEAKTRLLQALELLSGEDEYTIRVRCRVLDDLGLAHHGLREYPEALAAFEESLIIRKTTHDPYGIAQSSINIARTSVAQGDLATAGKISLDVVAILSDLPPRSLHANAWLLRAQVTMRQENFDEAIEFAQRSVELNQQLGNEAGQAKAHHVLSRALADAGHEEASEIEAERSREVNRRLGTSEDGGASTSARADLRSEG